MEPKKRSRRRDERVQNSSFMDTVRDAFIRWVALEKWRAVEDLRSTVGLELAQALAEAARFPGRGRYEALWIARWKAEVCAKPAADSASLFGAIEKAVAAALKDEEAERKSSGDRALEEDPEYKGFVDAALERLLRQGDLGIDS